MHSTSFIRFTTLALAAVSVTFQLVCAVPMPAADGTAAELVRNAGLRTLPKQARGHGLTNAQRFAAGLPPANPKRKVRRSAPSASLSLGVTPIKQKRSKGKNASLAGIISVIDPESGSSIGYVSRSFTSLGQYTLSSNPNMALEISFSADHLHYCDLRVTAPQDDDLAFFGAITANTNRFPQEKLGLGSSNYAHLGLTSQTSLMSPPVNGPNAFTQFTSVSQKIESSIWTFDPSSGYLIPKWINADGKPAESTKILYLPRNGTFAITGDAFMHQNMYGDGAQIVNFGFVHDA